MLSLTAAVRATDGRVRPWVVLLVLVAMVPMAAGCYGRFPLTKSVYKFNTGLSDDDLVRSVAMWLMVVVPIYEVATLGDVLVIHLIEFWSGERVDVGVTTIADGTSLALAPSADGRTLTLTVRRDGRELSRAAFTRTGDGRYEVRDLEGNVAGTVVRGQDGDLLLTDARGRAVAILPAEAIAGVSGG